MDNLVLYVKESYNELLHNVTWPTWAELISSAKVVLIASIIIALIIFLMDTVFNTGLSKIYQLNFS